jgi:glutathione S-transferase
MSLLLYAHPFSSYCQKVLTGLYENDTPFTYRNMEEPGAGEELAVLWPMKRFPVLVDDNQAVIESSVILEHLDLYHPGSTALIPPDAKAAQEARFMDRFFDIYVHTPTQKLVGDRLRPEDGRDPFGVTEAKAALDRAYGWLENQLVGRTWAAGEAFTLADCAAAPALFYSDWSHKIGPQFSGLLAYRARLLARPSFARAVDEARPYRAYFPLGAPDRD